MFPLIGGAMSPSEYPAMLRAECARLNRAGLTTCSDMAFDPNFGPLVEQLHDELTVRLRTYEVSNPQMSTAATPGQGDDMLRQVGIKIWVDGSPWIGNIALSFPYLDTAATRAIGVTPGSCGCANYTAEQLTEIVSAYFPLGWQMACHVQGDAGIDTILDVYEQALRRNPRDDHRLRLEHVGAIRPEQLQRAADLGVTCSIFVDQIHYWGDVLVDGLFGPERGSRWMPAGSAVATGMRISLHNDPPVTPEEPLRNISVAVTRMAPSGRVLAPEERLTVEQAIRAQTIDAAWQLFADDIIGSLEVGKYADLVVLSADPADGAAGADRRPRRACDVSGGSPGLPAVTPTCADLLDRLHVVALPMRVRFRGITTREVALIEGPAGWGEFGAFVEYQAAEAAAWLASGIEAAYREPPPYASRPHSHQRHRAGRWRRPGAPRCWPGFPGVRTAKVKVAEPGQTLADDVERVNAVRELVPVVRVDANGGWTVQEAADGGGSADRRRPAGVPRTTLCHRRRTRRAAQTP